LVDLLFGGHIDSVPNGGWLDGALNVVAGAEVLRRIAEEGKAPVTVRLVNWADEEGARFGRSLFGSSAAAGSMADQDELRSRLDAGGQALPEVLSAHGVDLDRALEARSRLDDAAAYLELHIEQGPVLEALDLPLGVVLGTFGVERHQITFRGQAAHAGSTPMDKRRDALGAAAKLALEIREIAKRTGDGPSARWEAASRSPASSPRWSKPAPCCSTSAIWTPGGSLQCSPRRRT
jgi:N-carbamoyl-L-amino-acid hydrolase